MYCDKCREILSFYVLNELPQNEADEVAKHLKECQSCSKQANELSALLSKVTSLEAVEPPDDFLDKVTKRAEKELWTSKFKIINYRTFLKIASIAAIFTVSFIAFRNLDGFRAKTSSMSMNSAQSATAAYGNAIGSTENGKADGSASINADTTTKAIQDSNTAMQDKDNTTPKVAYDAASATGNVSRANNYTVSAKDVYTSATPAPEKSETVNQPKADGNITVILNDNADSSLKLPVVTPAPSDVKIPEEQKTAKTLAGDNKLTVAAVLADAQAETRIQVKTKDKAAAAQWIKEQAQKINETELTVSAKAKSADTTTQESTYAAAKTVTAESVPTDGDKIVIEVSKENADAFKNSLTEHFGKDNVVIEESTETEGTVKFSVEITE